jgi:hypothetical protein
MFKLLVVAVIGIAAWHFSFDIADVFESSGFLFIGFILAVGICLVAESCKRASLRSRRF